MGFLHIGQNVMLEDKRIIGIFDLDITSQSKLTRQFLTAAEENSVVLDACEDIPKSFVVCWDGKERNLQLLLLFMS